MLHCAGGRFEAPPGQRMAKRSSEVGAFAPPSAQFARGVVPQLPLQAVGLVKPACYAALQSPTGARPPPVQSIPPRDCRRLHGGGGAGNCSAAEQ